MRDIPLNAKLIYHSDPQVVLGAARFFRQVLSLGKMRVLFHHHHHNLERNPAIAEVVDANVTERLIELCKDESQPGIQFECAWALTNIASGESKFTKVVVDKGILPIILRYIPSKSRELSEQVC